MAVRTPTAWTPPSGLGYVSNVGNELLVTNSGLFLTDNLGNQLVTTTTVNIPKFVDAWTKVGKNNVDWDNNTLTIGVSNNISDQTTNLVVDQSGNFVVDGGLTATGKADTAWTGSGV